MTIVQPFCLIPINRRGRAIHATRPPAQSRLPALRFDGDLGDPTAFLEREWRRGLAAEGASELGEDVGLRTSGKGAGRLAGSG